MGNVPENFRMLLWVSLICDFFFPPQKGIIHCFFVSVLWQSRRKISSSLFYSHLALNMLQQMFDFAISRIEVCSCSLLIILGKDFDIKTWLLSPFYICICVSSHAICPLYPRKGNEYLWLNQIGVSNQVVLIFAWVRNTIYEHNWDKIKVLYVIRIIAACHHFPLCIIMALLINQV